MTKIKARAWYKGERFPFDKNDLESYEKPQMIYDIQEAYDGGGFKSESGVAGHISCFGDFLDDDRYIVEQYVGLKDRNDSRDVYAGDIVNIHIFVLGITPGTLGAYEDEQEFKNVEIKHGNPFDGDIYVPAFYFEYGEEIILLTALSLHEESVEVIGNIHENPELLEGSQNESSHR